MRPRVHVTVVFVHVLTVVWSECCADIRGVTAHSSLVAWLQSHGRALHLRHVLGKHVLLSLPVCSGVIT